MLQVRDSRIECCRGFRGDQILVFHINEALGIGDRGQKQASNVSLLRRGGARRGRGERSADRDRARITGARGDKPMRERPQCVRADRPSMNRSPSDRDDGPSGGRTSAANPRLTVPSLDNGRRAKVPCRSRGAAGIDGGASVRRTGRGIPRRVRPRSAAAARRHRAPGNAVGVDIDAATESDQPVGTLNDQHFLVMRTQHGITRGIVENRRTICKSVDEVDLGLVEALVLLPEHCSDLYAARRRCCHKIRERIRRCTAHRR